jgi:hypothetical protein
MDERYVIDDNIGLLDAGQVFDHCLEVLPVAATKGPGVAEVQSQGQPRVNS